MDEKLEERGLKFQDKAAAAAFLSHCNYYPFSGYIEPFQDRKDHFREGVTFEYIRDLYVFDRQRRELVLEAIGIIEVSARTKIACRLAEAYQTDKDCGAFSHIRH
ncbi:MAG: Abi family protein [Thermoguttaceae bacterium]